MEVTEDRRRLTVRMTVLQVGVAVAFTALAISFWFLQIAQHAQYQEMAENNHQRTLALRAPRGVLFDRNGKILVENRHSFNVSIVREHTQDLDRTIRLLSAVAKVDDGLEVRFAHDGVEKRAVADQVANGTGRIPNLDDLDLDAGGIDHDGLRIAVDDHLRSVSNSRVYVAGDALWSSAQLSPLASHEGRVVAENILNGDTVTPDYDTAPSAVFAVPALAGVGLTEEAATARGLRFAVKANDLTAWRSSQTHAETAGFSKVLIEAETDRILGAHILGHGAEEIVHLFAFAMKHGSTARGLGDTVTAYPTFSADIKHML